MICTFEYKLPRAILRAARPNAWMICTHLSAFFMLNSKMAMKISIFEEKKPIMFHTSSALDIHMGKVRHGLRKGAQQQIMQFS